MRDILDPDPHGGCGYKFRSKKFAKKVGKTLIKFQCCKSAFQVLNNYRYLSAKSWSDRVEVESATLCVHLLG